MARSKGSARGGRSGRGIVERTFDEVKSSLDSLRQLMESYLPSGKSTTRATSAGGRKAVRSSAPAPGQAAKRRKRARTRRTGAKG